MADQASTSAAAGQMLSDSDLQSLAGIVGSIVAAQMRSLAEGELTDILKSLSNLEGHLLHKQAGNPGESANEDGTESPRSSESLDGPRFVERKSRCASNYDSGSESLARGLNGSPADELNSLWHVWRDEPNDFLQRRSSLPTSMLSSVSQKSIGATMRGRGLGSENSVRIRQGLLSRAEFLVIRPNSFMRLFWDMSCLIVLGYEIFMIPLSVFEVGVNGLFSWIALATALFWSFDIVMCFLSGFYRMGVVELRLAEIARNYVHGSFAFDFILLAIDWLLTLSELFDIGFMRSLRGGKLFRFGKIVRILRLVRVVKLPRMLQNIGDGLQSHSLQIAWSIVAAVSYIAISNHYIACIWYVISVIMHEDFHEPAWVDKLYEEGGRDTAYFYFTALHWSVTQFTPASMEVQPRNSVERVFVVVVIFAALVVFSTFVSGITSAMTRLREHNRERYNQQQAINDYLADKKISFDLSSKIVSLARANNFVARRRRVCEQDVPVFKALPAPLKLMLRFEAHGPILFQRPFFFQLNEYDREELVNICSSTVTELHVDVARELFTPGQDAGDMYCLLGGHVEYCMQEYSRQFAADDGDVVFCEAALWIRFQHPGGLLCKTSSHFLAMSSASFRGIVLYKPELHSCCCRFASHYLSLLHAESDERTPAVEKFDVDAVSFDGVQEIAQKAFESDPSDLPADSEEGVDQKGDQPQGINMDHYRG